MSAPTPGSPEWLKLITSSKIAAIVGVSPYQSPYSLWHQMKGLTPAQEQTSVMSRGHYLEGACLDWWADNHSDFTLLNRQHYATVEHLPWAAATLDAIAANEQTRETVIVEAKTSTKSDEWGDEGTDAIPSYYLTQIYWQLAMTPYAKRAYVVLLGAFLEFKEFVIERDEVIQSALIAKAQDFFDSLSLDVPPALDDTLATFECLKALHPEIDKGSAVEIDEHLATAYLHAIEAEKGTAAIAQGLKSQILEKAGKANYVESNGVRIARRQPNRSGVSLVAVAK